MSSGVCTYCGRPSRGGSLCATHRRRKRLQLPMLAPIRSSLVEPDLEEAALRYADASSEDDEEARKRKKDLRQVHRQLAAIEHHHRIKQGLWRRKAAGLPLGRPPKLTRAQAQAAIAKHGGQRRAARALGVSREVLRRALKRGGPENSVSEATQQGGR